MNSRTLPALVSIILLACLSATPGDAWAAMNLDLSAVEISSGIHSEKDAVAAGIRVGWSPEAVDALAQKEQWVLLSQSPTSRKYRIDDDRMLEVVDVRFRNGVVKSVTVDITMTKEQFDQFGEVIPKIRRVYVDRAERTEGRGENAVYVTTSRKGSTVRVKWIVLGARSFRIEAVVSR